MASTASSVGKSSSVLIVTVGKRGRRVSLTCSMSTEGVMEEELNAYWSFVSFVGYLVMSVRVFAAFSVV